MKILDQISKNLRAIVTTAASECAEEAGLVERRGGKVNGQNLCQTLVFGWWQQPDATLACLCDTAKTVGLDISPQGLSQWFSEKTSVFFRNILAKVIQVQIVGKQTSVEALNRFSNVYLEDSSSITLPSEIVGVWQGLGNKNGQTSAVKIQTRFEITKGTIEGPHLVNEKVHDRVASELHPPIEENSLRIIDLGYWLLDDWEHIVKAKAYFLTRMKSQVKFLYDDIWWTTSTWTKSLPKTQQAFEITTVMGKKKKLKVSVMGKRVRPKTAAERRRKMKRKYEKMGKTVSQDNLDLCDWTILVTNAPEEKIAFEDAFIFFRVRWQIELLFKLWKSQGKIDEWRSNNPWRCLTEFYAKLIAMLFQQWCFAVMIWQNPARSLVKASRSLRAQLMRIVAALPSKRQLKTVLRDLCRILGNRQFVNTRQSNPSSFQLLLALTSDEVLA